MSQYGQNILVTLPSRDLRKVARESLRGKWMIAVIGTFIYLGIVHIPTTVLNTMFPGGFASNLFSLVVTGAFVLGYAVFLIALFRNKNTEYSQLFTGFENIVKTMGLYLYMGIFIGLWALLFIFPGIIAAVRYSQSFYILADHPEMTIREVVNESKRMMRGNIVKYICLDLSFIGWDILASVPSAIASAIISSIAMMSLSGQGLLDGMLADGLPDAQVLLTMVFGRGVVFIFELLMLVLSAGYLLLMPYRETAHIAMYDIMAGNLQPGYIYAKPAPETAQPAHAPEVTTATETPEEPAQTVESETETVTVESEDITVHETDNFVPTLIEDEVEIIEAEIVEDVNNSEA